MKTILITSWLLLGTTIVQAQANDLIAMQQQLTGAEKTRWIFDKLEKTMGQKNTVSRECVYSRIIFALKEKGFLANKCNSDSLAKGKWMLVKRGSEDFTLKLDQVYDIDFYNKVFENKERRFMRLKIPGATMQQPSLEYHYYAE